MTILTFKVFITSVYTLLILVDILYHAYQARIQDKYWSIPWERAPKVQGSGGMRGHAPAGNALGFWTIQTGFWPIQFSSDDALQIGGFFHLSISTWRGFSY